MPVAAIALPRPAGPRSFDLESRNLKGLHLISFRLARTRVPEVARLSSQCGGPAATAE
jgi:hypothetical protein